MPFSVNSHSVQLEGSPLTDIAVEFADDFTHLTKSDTADTAQWTVVGTSAALTIEDAHGGVGKLVSNTTNVASAQGTGGIVKLKAGRRIEFHARIGAADADGQQIFAGLAASNLADGVLVYASGTLDYIGFYTGASAADLYYGAAKNATNVPGSGGAAETDDDTGVDLSNASISSGELSNFTDVAFVIDGTSKVRYFVDGDLKAEVTTDLPDDVILTPVIETLGSGETLYADYVLVTADR
jgi:hypothetical protein